MRLLISRARPVYRSPCLCNPFRTIATSPRHYQVPALDNIEKVEDYRYGGFHPVSLGDTFGNGRYRVLHKLGFGGFSTVWLARDEQLEKLVSLKLITAETSRQCREFNIFKHLEKDTANHPGLPYILSLLDHFSVKGPNGTHLCLVHPFAGPSVSRLSFNPGQPAGSRRLHSSLARKIENQVALSLGCLHSRGIVHGDLTACNVLLQLADTDSWSDQDVYERLGSPTTEKIHVLSKAHNTSSAPECLVEPADIADLDSRWFTDRVFLIDFGQSFLSTSPAPDGAGTPFPYCSPEIIFENKVSKWSDIWALGCTMFEIHAGTQLFASFFGGPDEVIRQIVQTLGKPPERWWSSWNRRHTYFNDDGTPKTSWPNNTPLAVEYPLRAQIEDIGADGESTEDAKKEYGVSTIFEQPGTRLSQTDVEAFEDLLHKVIKYTPEERLPIDEVLAHPWFSKLP